MKFGLFFHVHWREDKSQKQVYADLTEEVQFAEQLGFHSVWMAEHHFTRYGLAPSPLQLATYLAAKTEKIRFGTAILVLPIYDPVLLAEQVAMLDVLSNGRVDLGVGRGLAGSAEQQILNVPSEQNEARFAEMLDILPALWTRSGYTHKGTHYDIQDVTVLPRPVQQPHPPIYVAVTSSGTRIRQAVERGWQVCSGVTISYADHVNIRQTYKQLAAEMEKQIDASESPFFFHTYVTRDSNAVKDATSKGLWWMNRMNSWRSSITSGSELDASFQSWVKENPEPDSAFDDVFENRAFFGTPEEVTVRIKELQERHGVQYYGCDFAFGGNSHSMIMSNLELFASEVMPHFK